MSYVMIDLVHTAYMPCKLVMIIIMLLRYITFYYENVVIGPKIR